MNLIQIVWPFNFDICYPFCFTSEKRNPPAMGSIWLNLVQVVACESTIKRLRVETVTRGVQQLQVLVAKLASTNQLKRPGNHVMKK